MGGDLVREARRRAGLTQRELAERAGTTQSAIARLERGRSSPSLDTVRRLVRLCGLDLEVMLVEADNSDVAQAGAMLSMTVEERADHHDVLVETLLDMQREVQQQLTHAS